MENVLIAYVCFYRVEVRKPESEFYKKPTVLKKEKASTQILPPHSTLHTSLPSLEPRASVETYISWFIPVVKDFILLYVGFLMASTFYLSGGARAYKWQRIRFRFKFNFHYLTTSADVQ